MYGISSSRSIAATASLPQNWSLSRERTGVSWTMGFSLAFILGFPVSETESGQLTSIGAGAGDLDHLGPARDFLAEQPGEFVGRVADRFGAQVLQLLLHVRRLGGARDRIAELCDDFARGGGGSEYPVPHHDLDT